MADIELIIKIPESMYEGVMLDRVLDTTVIRILDEIKNSTPLPKGHGRLIDADKFQRDDYLEMRYGYDFYREFQSRLKRQLTVVEADKEN